MWGQRHAKRQSCERVNLPNGSWPPPGRLFPDISLIFICPSLSTLESSLPRKLVAMSQEDVTRAESIDEQERARAAEGDKKPKSRRPASAHHLPARPPTANPRPRSLSFPSFDPD